MSRLQPITRDFLREMYEKLPIESIEKESSELLNRLSHVCAEVAQLTPSSSLAALQQEAPHKIDENFYRNRQECELVNECLSEAQKKSAQVEKWILDSRPVGEACFKARGVLLGCASAIEQFQADRKEQAEQLINKFLPNDFRTSIIRKARERSERKSTDALATLVRKGGTVSEKFDLLWEQQMKRRQLLVQLGSASGIFKAIIKLLSGIPQVLLDFLQRINDEEGPMEETRARYGPYIYTLTRVARSLRCLIHLVVDCACGAGQALFSSSSALGGQVAALILDTCQFYQEKLGYYCEFMTKLWNDSPFFLEDWQVSKCLTDEPATEVEVKRGDTHDICLPIAEVGTWIGWEFETAKNDIGVALLHNGKEVVANQRFDSHKIKVQGSHVAQTMGNYTLRFDNTFSRFTKKVVYYRTLLLPPTAESSSTEEDLL